MADSEERVVDLDNSPAYYVWWIGLPHVGMGWTPQAYGYEAWKERGRRDAAEIERLQSELKIARQECADAVNHANNLRPHTWQQQRQHLVDEVSRLQAQLAARDDVIAAARKVTGNILASHLFGCGYLAIAPSEGRCPCGNRDLRAALARLDASAQESSQQAAVVKGG